MQTSAVQVHSIDSHPGTERLLGVSASALALAACGGGGSGSATSAGGTGGAAQGAVSPNALPDAASASRLINQAAFGGNRAALDAMTQKGASAWLTEQMDMPRSQSMTDWLIAKGFADAAVNGNINGDGGWPNAMWWKLFAAPDAVRQRAVLAWSEIFVVSSLGLGAVTWKNFALANYWDILEKNAFGNFRSLLDAITLSSAMGSYLNMKGNQKANAALGRLPDENYAREVMQLFTIGLYRLQADGSLALDGSGTPQETYDNTDIQGLAKVFTGWNASTATDPSGVLAAAAYRHGLPMVLTSTLHSPEEKRFLGQLVVAKTTVTAEDGAADLKFALDALFNHPNTPPFISKQLIQRLVTSNPSGAYVARVAAVFANNGAGVRGDLRAVFQAIWLDAEARTHRALCPRLASCASQCCASCSGAALLARPMRMVCGTWATPTPTPPWVRCRCARPACSIFSGRVMFPRIQRWALKTWLRLNSKLPPSPRWWGISITWLARSTTRVASRSITATSSRWPPTQARW